ncbi:AAA domain-containing protein [Sphingobacterium faecale]|uniref:AAA family ATPase n=1 Tax=Sphingobacterium faecale TaxID=2803775 RepID=A0ABS1R008_9SPHI|nr:AAA domain-containing protein [Sphingobacterium faecale]MBL1407604.1 AAA family ATPase [Sphingobacterium faecale]
MDYFKDLARLLQIELSFDREEHGRLLSVRSISDRKALGITWYPVQITDSGLGRGDYLQVTFNKTNDFENSHRFRFGMPVALFSNHDSQQDRIQGVITFVNKQQMRVSFRTEELPEWGRKGKLGVDLMFDENSYREMSNAMKEAETLANDPVKGGLVRKLIGVEPLSYTGVNHSFEDAILNPSQNQAVQQILSGGDLTILHGPPGTGKTTTLIKAITALLNNSGQQLLIVAPSNTAVDVLAERLDRLGINVLRIGNPVRVSDRLQDLTLEEKSNKHPGYREVKALEKQARAYTDMAHKYKRSFGRAEYEQRKALLNEAKRIRKDIDRIQDYVIEDILSKSQVIAGTLVGANHSYIRDRHYHTVIVDEAAQALEPACWIPILKADRLILAGDHCQLPPTVKSEQRESKALFHTLFEKLVELYPESVSFLDTQYRMNQQIMAYPAVAMYGGKLNSGAVASQWTLAGDTKPLMFIDTAGSGFEEQEEDGAISNKEEAHFLINHLHGLQSDLVDNNQNIPLPSVGIITPYRKQAILIADMLTESNSKKELNVQINTIDGFQGQEKDIIYISLVRSNTAGNIGFLSDVRRMNVAMTRARKKLIVIGDSSTIGQYDFYREFFQYVESIEGYHSVWEWSPI